MISTTSTISLTDSGPASKIQYEAPDIICSATIFDTLDAQVTLRVFPTGDYENVVAVFDIYLTKSEITANTEAGADMCEKFYNLIEQAVVDRLQPFNGGATFTIT